MLHFFVIFITNQKYTRYMKKQNLPIYIVKKSDTLNSIAQKYNINPTEILIKNSITPKQIKEGTILSITPRSAQ